MERIEMSDYKLVESNKYLVGDNANQWYLYVGLYQYRDNYYYILFDKDQTEWFILSAIVSPKTANILENSIHDAIRKLYKIETLQDVFDNLQNDFYGDMFKIQKQPVQ